MDFGQILKEIRTQRDRLLFLILLETGCNVSEVAKIKIRHIDIKKKILLIPKRNTKNKIRRKINLSGSVINEIIQFIDNKKTDDFLFISRQSSTITTRRIEQIIKSYSGLIEVVYTPRDIRNRFLSETLKKSQTKIKLINTTGLKNISKKNVIAIKKLNTLRFLHLKDEIIIRVLAETGCTVSELTTIKVRDINKRLIIIGKTRRKIRVSKALIEKINNYANKQKKENFLISGKKKITSRRIQQIVKSYSDELKYDISPSIIRNSYLYSSYNLGTPKEELQEMLGIKKINLFTHGLI